MLENNSALKSKIHQLYNKFQGGGISDPLTAIEQITYLIFMKRLDSLDLKSMSEARIAGEKYNSKFDGEFNLPGTQQKVDKQTLRWSYFKKMSAEEMFSHIQMKVFPFLKTLDEAPFTYYMEDAVFIIPKPALLVEAIFTIDEIFDEIQKVANKEGQDFQEIQGKVYEMLLFDTMKAGRNGQFKTPRHIIKLITELVEPQLGDRIADPACGTGGFLLGAYQYIVTRQNKNKKDIQPDEDGFIRNTDRDVLTSEENEILNDSLYGYDANLTMVRLALMNLMLHGVETPHIEYKNIMNTEFTVTNQYHIVMANPPFGGVVSDDYINDSFRLKTKGAELLFLEVIYNSLKRGGTASVIVSQGVLFGNSRANIEARRILIEECELKAVINMPSGVFNPYSGLRTAILIFTKGSETKNVWFYDMQEDGYSFDNRRRKLEGYGDLQDILIEYKKRQRQESSERKGKFFSVPKKEIVEEEYNLSMDRYKHYVFEEIEYEKPVIILAKLKSVEDEIRRELNVLEELLGEHAD
ncbi:DNA methyltransferase [Bacillus thuringiensis]|uniref:type I restriction-modification system subunit M n=1 Tax=Bacillus thuringiensis TaxID=1428 RepID=UPI000C9E9EDA|nr:type I restriction-modification system subunit M [Bacillus thuringiensis]MDA2274045.1 N-6 DNA methylase [Bacillus cereus]PNK27048.1 DNA methyltransferase [Bacillus thuringiensis]PNK54484.1 DNA methyltransferase [Bacillus thuringiensis]